MLNHCLEWQSGVLTRYSTPTDNTIRSKNKGDRITTSDFADIWYTKTNNESIIISWPYHHHQTPIEIIDLLLLLPLLGMIR